MPILGLLHLPIPASAIPIAYITSTCAYIHVYYEYTHSTLIHKESTERNTELNDDRVDSENKYNM